MTMKDDGLCETVMVISLAGPKHQGAGEIGDVKKIADTLRTRAVTAC